MNGAEKELEVQTNRLIPTFCKLMSDPHADSHKSWVRSTLTELTTTDCHMTLLRTQYTFSSCLS
ncbi:hypothetical protein KIN20_008734 [Parelaphostrongylus tenuis]|uniref:Uncharacterized protein n=1 Tax=Parelaphostrongylus tenuis TaxID=148309 RepID=A0AAD5QMV3_PARTN|nr:hypothetical protein KIN20_008734 [Parelaphostrongylus tenuis]